jgi:uncharacterized integral membrane protein (TIGR00698 family)
MSAARSALPGLVVCAALAGAAFGLAELAKPIVPLSPLLLVIVLGMAVGTALRLPEAWVPGVVVAQRPLLRWAVGLLGLRLSFSQLAGLGGTMLLSVAVATAAALAAGYWLGRAAKLSEAMTALLAAGGAICGASAIVAADSVVESKGEESAAALGVITLWGTVGIFVLPPLGHALGMGDPAYGVFAGATLHEMAQAVAGAQAFSPEAANVATVTKLARICLLAPVVLGLSWWLRRTRGAAGQAKVSLVPWFLVAFVVCAAVRSLAGGSLPATAWKSVESGVLGILTVGMAGVGLRASLREVAAAGWRPVLVGLGQWAVLLAVALVLVQWGAPPR